MKCKDPQMESVRRMVYKFVNHQWKWCVANRRDDIEFEDLEGEAWWVYSWCLSNFDGKKGMKFETYLYMNLKSRLKDYCTVTMKPISRYPLYSDDDDGDKFEESIAADSRNGDAENAELMADAKEWLSYEGYRVFEYIVSREWECRGHSTKPSSLQIRNKTGFPSIVVDDAMSEIREFWQERCRGAA